MGPTCPRPSPSSGRRTCPSWTSARGTGWIAVDWKELYHYRELLYFLTWRDFKVRYKQTVLGVLWAVLVPVAQLLVFTLVFGAGLGVQDRLPEGMDVRGVRLCGPAAVDLLSRCRSTSPRCRW